MDERSAVSALIENSHFIVPDDLPALAQSQGEALGAQRTDIYLVDLNQHWLVPVRADGSNPSEELAIDGTLAGRSFRLVEVAQSPDEATGGTAVWVPLLDGTERLGVLRMVFLGDAAPMDEVKAFAGLIAQLVMSKSSYGDFFEVARRRTPVTVGSELLWQLLPPLTFGTDGLVITAWLMPTERLGGDAFDYGVDREQAQLAVFDAVGHDLPAGLLATTAVAAFRNARRSKLSIGEAASNIGKAITDHFDESKFVTGIVASLERASGRLSWCVAGHPAPLLLRHGRVVKHLDSECGLPFGVGPVSAVASEQLEPGDRVLLYTDGVTEARSPDGEFFGLDRLVDLVSRTAESDAPPETMRVLMHAIESHSCSPMRDDATAVLLEWRGPSSRKLEL